MMVHKTKANDRAFVQTYSRISCGKVGKKLKKFQKKGYKVITQIEISRQVFRGN
jgi:hypothetical protein